MQSQYQCLRTLHLRDDGDDDGRDHGSHKCSFRHVHDGAHARGRDRGDARDGARDRVVTLFAMLMMMSAFGKRPLLQAILSQDRFLFHRIQNLFSVDLILES